MIDYSRRFNPFSFRSPSKPATASHQALRKGFNPFSFRSPSKHGRPLYSWGLRTRFNPFSFRSPSKRWQGGRFQRYKCFNPFSFRSPSKRGSITLRAVNVSIPSRSGLLQNPVVRLLTQTPTFQSLLVQVSFKTARARNYPNFQTPAATVANFFGGPKVDPPAVLSQTGSRRTHPKGRRLPPVVSHSVRLQTDLRTRLPLPGPRALPENR